MVLLLGQLGDFLERLGEQGIHLGERGRHALLGHTEQRLLSVLHHLVQVVGRVVGQRVDGGGGVDELAEDGRALHDLGVVLPVRERERVVGQIDQVRLAAHGLQLAHCVQVVGERYLVDGNAARVQLADGLEDNAVRRAVERLGLELQDELLHRLGVQHAGRQDGLLGLDVLRHRLVLRRRSVVEVVAPCAGLVRFRHSGSSRSFRCPLPCSRYSTAYVTAAHVYFSSRKTMRCVIHMQRKTPFARQRGKGGFPPFPQVGSCGKVFIPR